ncbi:hypothetical protein U879_20215 [Defluviimonas sp. 20V17]|uniref:Uncharacterized protein n=1 Tax=Allgaiera indica TaxID=765699 RepID=A0AAN4US11_9RHOB|nr:hypothetical protein [Allgaiera indica]KDB01874.1 hypothetical protein U879_20215 [Defluviimonas sp. 20V17]GHE02384.1 hypothetical protein GCM10008024_21630 [Allgaiera indica]SDX30637.1 hypothetical protein SAMN05444006_11393 [Allgaiera indica]
MSVSFTILPRRGLVYVRYEGFVHPDDTQKALAAYSRHPDRAPGQKQLVDLAAVTGYDADYARILQIQAQKAETFLEQGRQTVLVYYAPTRIAHEMAAIVRRSWEGLDGIVMRTAGTEAEALEILGQPECSLTELLAGAG